jgi:8-oxo-dGTP diphosphatase
MDHRISAGAIVEHDNRVLLVRHKREDRYDFWVAPGGGAHGNEELTAAAAREVREETGLIVQPNKLAYIEEFYSPETRYVKFWFTAALVSGDLNTDAPEAQAEYIIEAGWFGQLALSNMQVFPSALINRYWEDRRTEFAAPMYLGLRAMDFW